MTNAPRESAPSPKLRPWHLDRAAYFENDSLNRLIQAHYPAGSPGTISYTYDAMGNRLSLTQDGVSTSYAYDAADRLLSVETNGTITSYNWDANCNLLAKGSEVYTWDVANRLIGWTDGVSSATYTYNGDGVRVGRALNGATTTYLQDLASGLPVVLRETGQYSIDYVYGTDLLASINSGAPTFYHIDGSGSARLITGPAGIVIDRYSYDAFGRIRNHNGSSPQPFTYTGEQADPEAGLMFLRTRYYDPEVGRFISSDPMPFIPIGPQTINRYVYTTNNPVVLTEPSGESAEQILDTGGKIIGGAGRLIEIGKIARWAGDWYQYINASMSAIDTGQKYADIINQWDPTNPMAGAQLQEAQELWVQHRQQTGAAAQLGAKTAMDAPFGTTINIPASGPSIHMTTIDATGNIVDFAVNDLKSFVNWVRGLFAPAASGQIRGHPEQNILGAPSSKDK